jgi:hypothetical protein
MKEWIDWPEQILIEFPIDDNTTAEHPEVVCEKVINPRGI